VAIRANLISPWRGLAADPVVTAAPQVIVVGAGLAWWVRPIDLIGNACIIQV
jgi:hypothetical protein